MIEPPSGADPTPGVTHQETAPAAIFERAGGAQAKPHKAKLYAISVRRGCTLFSINPQEDFLDLEAFIANQHLNFLKVRA